MEPGEHEGSFDAPIVIVGEAFGQQEEWQKRPFIGPSGQQLHEWLTSIGRSRQDCFITNVVCRRPVGNDIKSVPADELASWTAQLHERLAQLTAPKVIVACGNTALRALSGRNLKVNAFRGSTLDYKVNGHTVPLVPILHPAFILRSPSLNGRSLSDWQRIAAILNGGAVVAPEITCHVWPNDDAVTCLGEILAAKRPIAIDIETIPDARIITSVSCANTGNEAVVFPTLPSEESHGVWDAVRSVCESPHNKVMQNGFYDWYWLRQIKGIDVHNYVYDPRWMHHALTPNDDHSLAYLASRFTAHDAWKHRGKSRIRLDQLIYNGMDSAITIAVARDLCGKLTERNLLEFYKQHYAALFTPLFEIMCRGIRVDSAKRALRLAELQARLDEIRKTVDHITGVNTEALSMAQALVAACKDERKALKGQKKVTEYRKFLSEYQTAAKIVADSQRALSLYGSEGGESFKKTAGYLYGRMKLPPRKRKGQTTVDETALRQIRLTSGRYKPEIAQVTELLLEQRGKAKLASTFLSDKIEDPDGRVRTEYNFTPKNGRLASGTNPFGLGANLQNISRTVRDIYLPDEGDVILECDLSQAEWRVVAMLTNDRELRRLANTRPHEFDIHKHNASLIFNVPTSDVTKPQRYLAKRACHAADYGMQAKKLAEILLDDGIVRTVDECQSTIDAYFHACPAILDWQRAVRMEVMRYKRLVNSWGRVITFEHDRLNDELYRLAYSWTPSSEVADLLNQWGLRPAHDAGFKTILQVHDALYFSCVPSTAYEIAVYVREHLERSRVYNGVPLTIPVTFTLHDTWGTGREFQQLPSVKEFTECAISLCQERGDE